MSNAGPTRASDRAHATRLRTLTGLVLAVCASGTACLDDNLIGTRPLSMEVTVDPAVAEVDEVVTAHYSATGTDIGGVIIDWGDGDADTIPYFGGAVVIEAPVEHQYQEPGTYIVVGTVEAQNGELSAEATVTVN